MSAVEILRRHEYLQARWRERYPDEAPPTWDGEDWQALVGANQAMRARLYGGSATTVTRGEGWHEREPPTPEEAAVIAEAPKVKPKFHRPGGQRGH